MDVRAVHCDTEPLHSGESWTLPLGAHIVQPSHRMLVGTLRDTTADCGGGTTVGCRRQDFVLGWKPAIEKRMQNERQRDARHNRRYGKSKARRRQHSGRNTGAQHQAHRVVPPSGAAEARSLHCGQRHYNGGHDGRPRRSSGRSMATRRQQQRSMAGSRQQPEYNGRGWRTARRVVLPFGAAEARALPQEHDGRWRRNESESMAGGRQQQWQYYMAGGGGCTSPRQHRLHGLLNQAVAEMRRRQRPTAASGANARRPTQPERGEVAKAGGKGVDTRAGSGGGRGQRGDAPTGQRAWQGSKGGGRGRGRASWRGDSGDNHERRDRDGRGRQEGQPTGRSAPSAQRDDRDRRDEQHRRR